MTCMSKKCVEDVHNPANAVGIGLHVCVTKPPMCMLMKAAVCEIWCVKSRNVIFFHALV